MILYQGRIVTTDGEHEYTEIEYVLARDLKDAERHFADFLSTYFGDDTLVLNYNDEGFERMVETKDGTLGARLGFVAPATRILVSDTEG